MVRGPVICTGIDLFYFIAGSNEAYVLLGGHSVPKRLKVWLSPEGKMLELSQQVDIGRIVEQCKIGSTTYN